MKIKVDGKLKFNVDDMVFLKKRGLEPGGVVQKYIDSTCLRLIEQYVPFRTGLLTRSGQTLTRIGSGVIRYKPIGSDKRKSYAARLYYNPQFNFNKAYHKKAGAYWFDRMKKDHGEEILEGAKRVAGAK